MRLTPRSIPLICLIAAEFLSQVGNQIAAVTIPILILQFTHSAIATGIAGAGNIIPIVLATFIGGKSIARFGAWRVSVTADVLSSISVLLLPIALTSAASKLKIRVGNSKGIGEFRYSKRKLYAEEVHCSTH